MLNIGIFVTTLSAIFRMTIHWCCVLYTKYRCTGLQYSNRHSL